MIVTPAPTAVMATPLGAELHSNLPKGHGINEGTAALHQGTGVGCHTAAAYLSLTASLPRISETCQLAPRRLIPRRSPIWGSVIPSRSRDNTSPFPRSQDVGVWRTPSSPHVHDASTFLRGLHWYTPRIPHRPTPGAWASRGSCHRLIWANGCEVKPWAAGTIVWPCRRTNAEHHHVV